MNVKIWPKRITQKYDIVHNSTKREWSHLVEMAKDSDKQTKQLKFKKYDILQNSNRWQMNGLIRQRWLNQIQTNRQKTNKIKKD